MPFSKGDETSMPSLWAAQERGGREAEESNGAMDA